MSFPAALIASPFAVVGRVTRFTGALIFARGRSGWLMIRRQVIDYRSSIGDPLENSIVGSVVGWIARNFPEAPVRIIREDDPDAEPIIRSSTGPGAMLRLLEKPNQWFSGVVMWKATIVDYLRGDAYWLKIRSGSGRVVELWWIPRSMLRPRWPLDNPNVFIGWYEYIVDGVSYAIDPRDVVHFRNGMDPATQGRTGVDELAALWGEIYTDEEAATFTASLLKNLGVPGVILAPANTTGGKPLDADTEAVKKRFMESFGGDRRGEPLVFSAPTEVKVLSWNPLQMDLKALRRIPEERVSARLGVPAGVAGLGAGLDRNTFTNYGEANVAAYTQGVIPRQREIAADLEVQLLPEFVGGAELETLDVYFDASVTAAMQALADSIWKRAESAATKGLITRARFKRMTGQKVVSGDDVYIRPNNYVVDDGGVTPPVVLPAPARPALPSGAVADVPLLEAGPLEASAVRCASCSKLLAERAAAPYTFTCPRCKAVTDSDAVAVEIITAPAAA